MPTHKIQYTIRGVPPATDRRLRKLAKISGKSLNDVLIDEISKNDQLNKDGSTLAERLNWFFGSGMDDDVIKTLEQDDKDQKELTRLQWEKDDS